MPVAFDTSGMEQYDERTWFCPRTGDQVSLTYIDLVPDLPAPLDNVPLLRHRLALETAEVGALIEAHVVMIDSVPALYQLLKLPIPDQDSGQAFIAAFTVPKATCSAVLRIQCAEGSPTGVRESAVIAQVGPEAFVREHPYAANLEGRLPWHVGDEERWDGRFPEHPLTRARAWAKKTIETARIDPSFARLAPFTPDGPGPNDHTDFHQAVERPALPPASSATKRGGARGPQNSGSHGRPDQLGVPDLRAPELEEHTKQIDSGSMPSPPRPAPRPAPGQPARPAPDSPRPARRSKLDSATAWQIPNDPPPSNATKSSNATNAPALSKASETIGARASRTRRAADEKANAQSSTNRMTTSQDLPDSRSSRSGSHRLPELPERPDSPAGRVQPPPDRSPESADPLAAARAAAREELDSPSGRHGAPSGPLSRRRGASATDGSAGTSPDPSSSGPHSRRAADSRGPDSGPLPRPSIPSPPAPSASGSPSGPAGRPGGPAPADPLAPPLTASSDSRTTSGDPIGSPLGSSALRRSPSEPPVAPDASTSGPLAQPSVSSPPSSPSSPPSPPSPPNGLTAPSLGTPQRPALGPGTTPPDPFAAGSAAANRIVSPHRDYPAPNGAGTFPGESPASRSMTPGLPRAVEPPADVTGSRRVPAAGSYPDSPTIRALPGYSSPPSGTFPSATAGLFPSTSRAGSAEESTDIRPAGFPGVGDYPGVGPDAGGRGNGRGLPPVPALPPMPALPPATDPSPASPSGVFPGAQPAPGGFPNGSPQRPAANGFPGGSDPRIPAPNGGAPATNGFPGNAPNSGRVPPAPSPNGLPGGSDPRIPAGGPGFPGGSDPRIPAGGPGFPGGSDPRLAAAAGFPGAAPSNGLPGAAGRTDLPPANGFPGASPTPGVAPPSGYPDSAQTEVRPANGFSDPMGNPSGRSGVFAPAGNGASSPGASSPGATTARVVPAIPAAPPNPVGRPMASATAYPSPPADPIGSPHPVGLPPGAPQPPPGAGDVMHTVLIGLPIGGYLPLWHNESVSYWRMADQNGVRGRLGIGLESRAEIDNRRFREAGLFAPDSNTLFLMDRNRNASGNLGGASTQLIPASEDEAYRAADDKAMSELYGWIGEVVVAAGQRGEYVAIETGGWHVPVTPVVLIMLRTDGREWHSVVETSPVPHGAPVWRDQQPVDGDTQLLASPATDRTMRAAGLLTRFAVATWPTHPFQLGLSFGPNPTLGDGATR